MENLLDRRIETADAFFDWAEEIFTLIAKRAMEVPSLNVRGDFDNIIESLPEQMAEKLYDEVWG